MDQGSYLSKALWHFRSTSQFTDLTIVCQDGTLLAHSALLAPLLISLGMKLPSNDDLPDCLVMPDLPTDVVERELKKIYRGHKATALIELLRSTESTIKLEISDYIKEEEAKPYENDDNKETLRDDVITFEDIYQEDDEPCVTETVGVLKEEFNGKSPDSDSKTTSTRAPRSSQKSKIMKCNKCGDECDGMKDLLAHVKEFHARTVDVDLGDKNWNDVCQCPYCENKLKGKHSFIGHLAKLHREEMILNHPDIELTRPCPDCDMMFVGVEDLDKHTRNIHSKSTIEWSCKFCEGKFGTKGQLTAHRKERHVEECLAAGIKSIFDKKQCPYCETKCNCTDALNGHIFHVHKDKRENHPNLNATHTCEHCSEEFYGRQRLRKHQLMKHTENNYCKPCYRFFTDSSALEEHNKNEHSISTTHICDVCCKEFDNKVKLKIHIKIHEDSPKKYKFVCTHCKSGKYQKEEHLDQHILENHSGKEYYCSQCPMVFNTPQSRSNHEGRNHKEKKIKCDQCDMMFTKPSYKNAHFKSVHLKEPDRICPHCGECFRDKNLFESHVNRHLGHRPHACELCGKTYLTERHLKNHVDTHTLPYQCDKCSVRTGSKMLLKDHIRVVHDGIQLGCR